VYISGICGQNPLGGLSPKFFGRIYLRRNHVFQIWWRSVKGFSVGWGSSFAIPHWLWRSSLQHFHTTVWACDFLQDKTATSCHSERINEKLDCHANVISSARQGFRHTPLICIKASDRSLKIL